jgi:hypothetical protein
MLSDVFRSSVLRFSRSFTKLEQSTENLPGYIPWEPVISMQSLRPNLLSSLLQHTRFFLGCVTVNCQQLYITLSDVFPYVDNLLNSFSVCIASAIQRN